MRTSGAPEKGAGDAHPWARFEGRAALRLHDAAHGLDDGARLPRDVLLRARCRCCRSSPTRCSRSAPRATASSSPRRPIGALAGSIFVSIRPLPSAAGRDLPLARSRPTARRPSSSAFRGSFVLTLVALAGVGLADAISTVIRQTLRQVITPDRLRGRMTSVNAIFFLGGPAAGRARSWPRGLLFASTAAGRDRSPSSPADSRPSRSRPCVAAVAPPRRAPLRLPRLYRHGSPLPGQGAHSRPGWHTLGP